LSQNFFAVQYNSLQFVPFSTSCNCRLAVVFRVKQFDRLSSLPIELEKGTITVLDLAQRFKESTHGQAIERQVTEIYNKMKANPNADAAINNEFEQLDNFATGWFTQVNYYSWLKFNFCSYTRKNLTSCSKSANKPSTSCVRTACWELSTSLEQAVNNL
jgi:hypothetical protein